MNPEKITKIFISDKLLKNFSTFVESTVRSLTKSKEEIKISKVDKIVLQDLIIEIDCYVGVFIKNDFLNKLNKLNDLVS